MATDHSAQPQPGGARPAPRRRRARGQVGRAAPWLRAVQPPADVAAPARVDSRTKRLLGRIVAGEIAVIDHADLDPVAAQGLIRAQVAGVVNAAESVTGRYPNVGPMLLVAAGIPLVDGVGAGVLEEVIEGAMVAVHGADVLVGDKVVATGTRHTIETLDARVQAAKRTVGAEIERFAANTLEYMRHESHLLVDNPVLPELRTELAGRHVLVVVRGPGSEEDLAALRAYIREMRPVMVGVDGGADLLVDAGYRPELVIGDFDSVLDDTLRTLQRGPQLVVHSYPGGRAPGAARLDALGLRYDRFEAPGTSEDVAMLLAYEAGAELIVAVGSHASMADFLDKGRDGMASTFLVRLKVGPILVDAKGVNQLYRGRVRRSDMIFLVGAAVLAMVVMALVAPPFHVFFRALWLIVTDAWHSLTG